MEQIKSNSVDTKSTPIPKCGIVMPISATDNCSAEHWSEVLSILRDVISNSGFEPNLVSDADDIGIIQKRIIQNLYNNEVVICDVSCKNPNVMFELGVRLAFDKPTIIIKDDKTDYTFDTSVIEHLSYPRDLRFKKIVSFKDNLKKKVQATYSKSKSDPNYSTFLKNFGDYKVAQLSQTEVTTDKFMLNILEELKQEIYQVKLNQILFSERPAKSERVVVRASSRPMRQQKANTIVDRLIDEFVKINKLKSRDTIWSNDEVKEDLFTFLEANDEIRKVCDGPSEVRDIMESQLIPF